MTQGDENNTIGYITNFRLAHQYCTNWLLPLDIGDHFHCNSCKPARFIWIGFLLVSVAIPSWELQFYMSWIVLNLPPNYVVDLTLTYKCSILKQILICGSGFNEGSFTPQRWLWSTITNNHNYNFRHSHLCCINPWGCGRGYHKSCKSYHCFRPILDFRRK